MIKDKCTATSKRSQHRCTNWPVKGATVCHIHGGKAPQVRAKAALKLVEEQARKAIRGVIVEPLGNPLTALSDVVAEIVAFKDYMAGEVERLHSLETHDDKGAEQIRAVIAAYERGLDRSATWLTAIARLNIDDRLARIEEVQMLTVIRAHEAALASIGIAGPAAITAREAFARKLRSA